MEFLQIGIQAKGQGGQSSFSIEFEQKTWMRSRQKDMVRSIPIDIEQTNTFARITNQKYPVTKTLSNEVGSLKCLRCVSIGWSNTGPI